MPRPFVPPADWDPDAFRVKCEAEFEKAAEVLRATLLKLSDENRVALIGYHWDGKPAGDPTTGHYAFHFCHRDRSRESIIVREDGSLFKIKQA